MRSDRAKQQKEQQVKEVAHDKMKKLKNSISGKDSKDDLAYKIALKKPSSPPKLNVDLLKNFDASKQPITTLMPKSLEEPITNGRPKKDMLNMRMGVLY